MLDDGVSPSIMVDACKRCTKLERVLYGLPSEDPDQYCYSQYAIIRGPADNDRIPRIMHTVVRRRVEIGALWWEMYGVV